MKNYRSRGFTLIELLVVIAIIGILSAVVLASLNTARSKGNDAAIQSDLSTIQTEAEIWYGNNGNSYLNLCTSDATVAKTVTALQGISGSSNTSCGSTATTYGASAKLTTRTTATYWCVDYSGTAATRTSGQATTAGCPAS
jgi:prepilin-type N-terminal cleavage/methylation domain-containing protein